MCFCHALLVPLLRSVRCGVRVPGRAKGIHVSADEFVIHLCNLVDLEGFPPLSDVGHIIYTDLCCREHYTGVMGMCEEV